MVEEVPKGFPGGFVPVVGEVVDEGQVIPRREGNRVLTGDEMEAAFTRHPWADWKPDVKRRRPRRR